MIKPNFDSDTTEIMASGAVLYRLVEDEIEIGLIHRPRYDDWSFPKGKIEFGESFLATARREVLEETGYAAKFGPLIAEIQYLAEGVPKRVKYWAAQAISEAKPIADLEEVDQFEWHSFKSAKRPNHHGVDFFATSGSNLKSPSDGVVIKAENDNGKCGGTLIIDHKNGFKSAYCHVKKFNVKKNDKVIQGQIVGLSGGGSNDEGRGNAQGAHLHFGLRKNDKPVDPMDYLDKSGIDTDLEIKNELVTKTEQSEFLEKLKEISKSGKEFVNLKKPGSKIPYDKDVEKIQTALQFLGYSLPKWGVDGLFGPETEMAVRSFESDNSITSDGKLSEEDLTKLFELLTSKGFKESDLSKIQTTSDFDKINVGNDKDFYTAILTGVGAPITDENLKFFYAWRKSEGGKATNNPFNTTYKLSKDFGKTNYNKVGVKNYSTPNYGIEATVKTLLLRHYTCIVDGLKNDIGAYKISKCESLKTWGTGDLVSRVLSNGDVTPPKIYA